MKKMAICFIMIFVLSPGYPAKEIISSKGTERIKIEPDQPLAVNIQLPFRKYFKVKSARFELDNIKQDLTNQYMLTISNDKGDSESVEEIQGKTWAVQEIISNDTFELSKVEIKMGAPLEDNLELLVCDNELYEKTRGVINYDESKKECFVMLDPTVQIQDEEHIFLAVKLAQTPISVKTVEGDRISAFYTDYPDGFKERDPFPEFLTKGLVKSKKSLIYKLYSMEDKDIQPTFKVKIDDSFDNIWSWNGEGKVTLKDRNIFEAIDYYFSENRSNLQERDGLILPIVFDPEGTTYPIEMQLVSWEMEIKIPEDYLMELKSAVNIVFKNNEEMKTSLSDKLQEIWDNCKNEYIDEVKDKTASFIQDVYVEEQQAQTRGNANEIRGIVDLAEEFKSMFGR